MLFPYIHVYPFKCCGIPWSHTHTHIQGSLDSYPTPEDPVRVDPEEFEYLLVDHSEQAITFLERLADPHIPGRQPLSPRLYTTLLGEYLHQYSLAPEGVCAAAASACLTFA